MPAGCLVITDRRPSFLHTLAATTFAMTALNHPSVDVTCLCGQAHQKLSLETTLPADSIFCHCNRCRWTTGTLFQSTIPITEPPENLERLSRYDSSDNVSRYFCGNCGSHVCRHTHHDDIWSVPSGIVDRLPKNEQVSSCRLQRIAEHQFVADTGDGGLAVCLTESREASSTIHLQGVDNSAADSSRRILLPPSSHDQHEQARLRAACDCGGVEFYLSRPNAKSREISGPWPDLLRPYHSFSPENPQDEKWWIRAGSTKFFAGTCACRTCRLSNSSPITTWTFVPRTNLSRRDGSSVDFDLGTLRTYQSSEGKAREFCRICGASVFWHSIERPELLDVSVGLLRAEEGARAETWLEWCTDRVSFAEEALDKDLIADFGVGLKNVSK